MNAQEIVKASEAVEWLSGHAGNSAGENSQERIQMALVLTLARSYMLEYATHITRGLEPYDALMAAARGDLELTDSQKSMVRALMPPKRPAA